MNIYKVILRATSAEEAERVLTIRLESQAGQPYCYEDKTTNVGADLYVITVATAADLAPLFNNWENEKDSSFVFFRIVPEKP